MNTKKIYHFKFQNRLLIAFETNIIVLDTTIVNRGGQQKNFSNSNDEYVKIPNFDLSTGTITDLQISSNEKLLAIASINNSNPQLFM